jgi:hypothetical protein
VVKTLEEAGIEFFWWEEDGSFGVKLKPKAREEH